MGRMPCYNCDSIMSTVVIPNNVEHYLVKNGVPDFYEKEYDQLIENINKDYKKWYEDGDEDYKNIDTWHDVCLEFGNHVWICKKCQTMHVFSRERPNEVEKLYKLVDKKDWCK